MIDQATLETLFRARESDRTERKRNIRDLDVIRTAICALANDMAGHQLPGVLFIGVEDDGSCSNLQIDDALLRTVSHLRGDGKLIPFPIISVSTQNVDGCEFVCVVVEATDNPPIRLDNRTYVRVGPTTRLANNAEEQRLTERRRWANLPFDAHAVAGATLQDLDLKKFELEFLPALVSQDALAANGRTVEERLTALRLIRPDKTPTTSAVLLFGLNPLGFLPGAFIHAIKVKGPELTSGTIDEKTFSGSIVDQLLQVEEYISLNIQNGISVEGSLHTKEDTYPIDALRQLIRNAVIHRLYESTNSPVRLTWYSDRIEIISPGGPYGQVTAENFGQPQLTDYRNPTLAGLLKELGFVERFGVGISIAQKALHGNGNPPAEFNVLPTHVHVTVRAKP